MSSPALSETPVITYSDDSEIEDLSNSDFVYFSIVEKFSNWCRDNSFELIVTKNKGNVD